jgi:hypothetical protein
MKPIQIDNFQGYLISEDGVVVNSLTDRILKTDLNSSGYRRVTLHTDNNRLRITVHRLVAIHYVDNLSGYEYVNHMDGNKLNNHYTNLEWCSSSHNRRHAFKHRLCQRPNSYLNDETVHAICLCIQSGMKSRNIQAVFNIPKHVYDDIRSRRYYKDISAQYTW